MDQNSPQVFNNNKITNDNSTDKKKKNDYKVKQRDNFQNFKNEISTQNIRLPKNNKIEKKRYEINRFYDFKKWLCSCFNNHLEYKDNIVIEDPYDVIQSKFDVYYYIKNMLLLDLFFKLEYDGKESLMNFLSVLPIFKKEIEYIIESNKNIEEEELYKS